MDTLATLFLSLMYGSEIIPDFLINRTGFQYKLISKKDIMDIFRAKNKSRRKLYRKFASSSSSSSNLPSTPGGGGTTTTSLGSGGAGAACTAVPTALDAAGQRGGEVEE